MNPWGVSRVPPLFVLGPRHVLMYTSRRRRGGHRLSFVRESYPDNVA